MNNRLIFIMVAWMIVILASFSWNYSSSVYQRIRQGITEVSIITNVNLSKSEFIIHLPDFNITVVPTLLKGTNQAVVSQDCPNSTNTPKEQFIIITNGIYVKHKKYVKNYEKTDPMIPELRWLEMMGTLQANLNHPSVKKLVVFAEHKEVEELLRRYDFENSNKLVIYNMGREVEMTHLFDYGTKCFKNEVIAVTNFDVKFGSGWEQLDFQHLRRRKLMYCLTRHASTSKCRITIGHGVCDEKFPYSGAHDTYVFHVKEHLTPDKFPELHRTLFNAFGMENIIIWTFKEALGYAVTNPCKILYVHHEHCVNSRRNETVRPRINRKHSGLAPFTDRLD